MSANVTEIETRAGAHLPLADLELSCKARTDWTQAEVTTLFDLPFNDLLFGAQWIHRQVFDPNAVQVSTLLSIKTGACPEDCAYCPQSIRYDTGVEVEELMSIAQVRDAALTAKETGATRFCLGAAYRGPKDQQVEQIGEMIREVRSLGLETCATVGLLTGRQAAMLADAGLDYYNHNLDTSESFYSEIISTRRYEDRLKTLEYVRAAGIKVCCGGILGMGETRDDRVELLHALATLPTQPESVPINQLVPIAGTPLEDSAPVDGIEFVRTVAVARILMPQAHVRLSAGRKNFSDELQTLCFAAGANSIFYGDKLLTTGNPDTAADQVLFGRLGLKPEPAKTPDVS